MTASVRLYGYHIGNLTVARNGDLTFEYAPQWIESVQQKKPYAHELSMALPVERTPFEQKDAGPFFDGLLPDNNNVRQALATHFQLDASDDYGLLYQLGRDCPGAVTIMPTDAEEISEERVIPEYSVMSQAELAQHLRDLPQRPLFVDADGELRLSLAGVHNKAAVIRIKNDLALTKGRTPTTHIVKVDIVGLPDSIRVENYCLHLAGAMGIDAVTSSIRVAEDTTFMLVSRYDRAIGGEGDQRYIRRFHQEDFCQALGRFPREKYEKDGGPGWIECFNLVNRSVDPFQARSELLRRAIFQFLVGNPDAHAKNYSLVYKNGGMYLSKFYDVNNAAAFRSHYKEQRARLAMFVGGERDPNVLEWSHWERFAQDIGIRPEIVRSNISEMSSSMPKHADELRKGMIGTQSHSELLDLAVADITERCTRVSTWFK